MLVVTKRYSNFVKCFSLIPYMFSSFCPLVFFLTHFILRWYDTVGAEVTITMAAYFCLVEIILLDYDKY